MKGARFLSLLTCVPGILAASLEQRAPTAWSNYNDNGLSDLSILLSWEDYDPNVAPTYWPVYKSTDGGASFQPLSRVEDQVNGWGTWYQPFLYELPQALGHFPKGTLLITGASTPRNLSHAYIDVYVSHDKGSTWKFVSHIVYGAGPETVDNGNQAVWEPFLTMYNAQLVCYYSTQADPAHAQKLAHKTTTNLIDWSQEVNDVASSNYNDRPGMATVAYSPKLKQYIMTFEYCGSTFSGGCPVHYKVSSSPLTFGNAPATPIVPNDTNLDPNGSPYAIWTQTGSDGSGVFIMDGSSREEVFVNNDAAAVGAWKAVNVGQWSAYSRSLRIVKTPQNSAAGGKSKLLIANGGNIGCSGSCYNYVATGLVDLPPY